MNVKTREALKRMVMKSGLKPLSRMEYVSALLRFRQWLEANDHGCPHLAGRPEIYQYVHDELLRGQPVDYLEFGVYEGYSMELQTKINPRAESRFWGFDSFEGLPEAWTTFNRTMEKGVFSTAGRTPAINDPRLTWVKGWFQDTLPGFCRDFQPRAGNRLVIHCDADLIPRRSTRCPCSTRSSRRGRSSSLTSSTRWNTNSAR